MKKQKESLNSPLKKAGKASLNWKKGTTYMATNVAELLKNQPNSSMVKPLAIEDMTASQCKVMNEKKGGLRGYDCPKCNNKGYYYTVNGMDFIAHECTCKPIRADLNRIKTSRLGASLEKCTFSSFQTSPCSFLTIKTVLSLTKTHRIQK